MDELDLEDTLFLEALKKAERKYYKKKLLVEEEDEPKELIFDEGGKL